jgi:hypothetical protein
MSVTHFRRLKVGGQFFATILPLVLIHRGSNTLAPWCRFLVLATVEVDKHLTSERRQSVKYVEKVGEKERHFSKYSGSRSTPVAIPSFAFLNLASNISVPHYLSSLT